MPRKIRGYSCEECGIACKSRSVGARFCVIHRNSSGARRTRSSNRPHVSRNSGFEYKCNSCGDRIKINRQDRIPEKCRSCFTGNGCGVKRGQKIGDRTVLSPDTTGLSSMVKVECVCGKRGSVSVARLLRGQSNRCKACSMRATVAKLRPKNMVRCEACGVEFHKKKSGIGDNSVFCSRKCYDEKNSRKIPVNGIDLTAAEIAGVVGCNKKVISNRIRHGIDPLMPIRQDGPGNVLLREKKKVE